MSDTNNDITKNPDVSYESKDFNPKTIAIAAGALLLLVIVAMVIVAGILVNLENRRTAEGSTPDLIDQAAFPPPAPRLQPNPIDQVTPAEELGILRAKEEAILNTYGWVDREAGIVRIPIEEAMKLVVDENQ